MDCTDSNNYLYRKVEDYRKEHIITDLEQQAISLDCALLGWHACIDWLESHDVDVHKAFREE